MNGALRPTKVSPESEDIKENENTKSPKGSFKQKKVESFIRHKEHVKQTITELENIETTLSKKRVSFQESAIQPGNFQERKSSFVRHKESVQNAIKKLESLDFDEQLESETTMKKIDKEVENTLHKQTYTEEEVDYTLIAKEKLQQEEEKAYKWVEKSIDQVYWITSVLILVASILSAFGTYMFVYLPKVIYSHHILHEIFLIHDPVIDINHFGRSAGLHQGTFLPLLIVLMFLLVLYLCYLIQYPKHTKTVRVFRYITFVLFELYMLVCITSYSLDASTIDTRLEKFFNYDKKGLLSVDLEDKKKRKYEKLHFLDHSQTYFGCCGYHSIKEWKEVRPENYSDSYPLSCCDEERSGIACWRPVHKKLTYDPPPKQDDKEAPPRVTKDRLHEETCFEMEQKMSKTVTSLVIIFVFFYIVLSIWAIVLISRISIIVTQRNMEIKMKPQYVDFF